MLHSIYHVPLLIMQTYMSVLGSLLLSVFKINIILRASTLAQIFQMESLLPATPSKELYFIQEIPINV